LSLFFVLSDFAQGTFENLNFEQANLTPIPAGQFGGEVPISSALPGWSGSIGGVSATEVLQNNTTLGQASIDILGPSWNSGPGIIDGNYSVYLQSGGTPGNSTTPANVSLWENGTIPANANSLEFSAWNQSPATAIFTVSFAGNSLSPVLLSSAQSPSGQPYNVYGVNLSSYAGQTGELEFTSVFNQNGSSWTELDDISFSTTAVPEPNSILLTGIGGLVFAWYRLRLRCR
jgi:hypothetical protein